MFPVVSSDTVAGGDWPVDGESRPYGVSLSLGTDLGTYTSAESALRICDITLTNSGIPVGTYYDMILWSYDNGAMGYVSAIFNEDGGLYAEQNANLRVNSLGNNPAVPEASAVMLAMSGLGVGLAGIRLRRLSS